MKNLVLLITGILFFSGSIYSQDFEYKDDNIKIKFTEFKTIGEKLYCKFMATAIENDETLEILMSKVKIYDMEGNEYFASNGVIGSLSVGKHQYLRSNLIADVPLNGEFVFEGAVSTRQELALLEIPFKLKNKNLELQFRMKKIKIPYGTSASNKRLISNKLCKEIDDNVFIELTSTKKIENNLVIEFIVTNLGDDKEQELLAGKCNCFDESGNEYIIKETTFGVEKGGAYNILRKKCIKDIPVKITITFEDLKIKDLKEVTLLEINMNKNKFQFKGLKL